MHREYRWMQMTSCRTSSIPHSLRRHSRVGHTTEQSENICHLRIARCFVKSIFVVAAGSNSGVEAAKHSLFRICLKLLQAAASRARPGKHHTEQGRHNGNTVCEIENFFTEAHLMPRERNCLPSNLAKCSKRSEPSDLHHIQYQALKLNLHPSTL
jgi:hypothetical protein